MPPLASTKSPRALALGAGERALLVSEQLRLEQGLGDRRAVDRHERPCPSGTVPVNGARGQLLAGSALADQEHGGLAARHRRDLLEHRLHRV